MSSVAFCIESCEPITIRTPETGVVILIQIKIILRTSRSTPSASQNHNNTPQCCFSPLCTIFRRFNENCDTRTEKIQSKDRKTALRNSFSCVNNRHSQPQPQIHLESVYYSSGSVGGDESYHKDKPHRPPKKPDENNSHSYQTFCSYRSHHDSCSHRQSPYPSNQIADTELICA